MFQAPITTQDLRAAVMVDDHSLPPPATTADRQFRAARAEALWRTTPTLAAVVMFATMLGAWFLRDAIAPLAIASWTLLVAAGVALLCRGRRRATALPDRALAREEWNTAAQTIALALVWLSLPAVAFGGQPAAIQAVTAGLVCLLMASGVLLVIAVLIAALRHPRTRLPCRVVHRRLACGAAGTRARRHFGRRPGTLRGSRIASRGV